MIKMNQAITQKFQPSNKELILGFVSGSTVSVFEDSENITNTYRPESSKLQAACLSMATNLQREYFPESDSSAASQ